MDLLQQDMSDALKIDRSNALRLERILRRLDDPDPTGEIFGIKADTCWADLPDEEMESAIGDGLNSEYIQGDQAA